MKTFTIRRGAYFPTISPGLPAKEIRLGEEGRGRTLTIVPILDSPEGVETIFHARAGKVNDKVVLKALVEPDDDPRALAVVVGEPTYVRGAQYSAYNALEDGTPAQGVDTLAAGYGAWGDAGRLGSWEEALLLLHSGARFRLRNRYRSWVIEYVDGDLHVLTKEEWEARQAVDKADKLEWIQS